MYAVSAERKEDQKVVDKQILEAIRQHPEKKLLLAYLASMFQLSKKQYPHLMTF